MSESIFNLEGKRVWVAGHRGMVGSALMRRLEHENCELVTSDRSRVDLRNQSQVKTWVKDVKPEVIFLAAAKVGGILANQTFPADFLYDNLMIEANIIHTAFSDGVEKLVFLGSSCIYPKLAPQPIAEDSLLSGLLEPTNEWYAIAKIAGVKLCQAYRRQHGVDFISAMPTNLYGPGDNFDLNSSHVMPALIRKAHEAKIAGAGEVTIWGTGSPRREFLHVDDCADALVHLSKVYSGESQVNVGSGEEITILELAQLVAATVGFRGRISCDLTMPDGTPRKLLSVEKLRKLGWVPSIGLSDGVASVYRWFVEGLQQTNHVKA
jgi:GDP-L-fucose synthase